jgi:hypothetical protein
MWEELLILICTLPVAILCSLWFIHWFVWMYHYIKTGEDLDVIEG